MHKDLPPDQDEAGQPRAQPDDSESQESATPETSEQSPEDAPITTVEGLAVIVGRRLAKVAVRLALAERSECSPDEEEAQEETLAS